LKTNITSPENQWLEDVDVSENGGFSPKSAIFDRDFPLFSPSILGDFHPYFWFNTQMTPWNLYKINMEHVLMEVWFR